MVATKGQTAQNPPKLISWEAFEKKYLSREDRFKYEWVNGTVEKTPFLKRYNWKPLFSSCKNNEAARISSSGFIIICLKV